MLPLEDEVEHQDRDDMRCIILAAGYATRMYPLTKDKAKALLPIAGKPILEHILDKVFGIPEITQVAVVSNATFFSQFQEWREGLSGWQRDRVIIINDGSTSEQTRRGAVGAFYYAIQELDINEDILAICGDNYFGFSLAKCSDAFQDRQAPVVALKDFDDPAKIARKYGVAELGENGRIIGFEEKPDKPRSALASTACYFLPRAVLHDLNVYVTETEKPDNLGSFIAWLAKRTPVYGYRFNEAWHDIGSIEDYQAIKDKEL